jgi:hypothetical protein
MIKLWTETTTLARDPGRKHGHLEAQPCQERRERTVEFVAEPSTMVSDDLLAECVFIEDYRAAEVNVKILERYREQVPLVKPTQSLQARPKRPMITNSLQIRTSCLGERPSLQQNLRPDLDRLRK